MSVEEIREALRLPFVTMERIDDERVVLTDLRTRRRGIYRYPLASEAEEECKGD